MLPARVLELLKWAGLLAMVVDHIDAFLLGRSVPWMFEVGRMAFPLFAISLAGGLSLSGGARSWPVVYRLVGWGLVAEPITVWVHGVFGLNILFTLAAGISVVAVVGRPLVQVLAVWCAVAVLSPWLEFGALGVLAVATACAGAVRRSWAWWSACAAVWAVLGVCGNGWGALLVVPLLISIGSWPAHWAIPRGWPVRRFFYLFYPAHYALVGVLAAILR